MLYVRALEKGRWQMRLQSLRRKPRVNPRGFSANSLFIHRFETRSKSLIDIVRVNSIVQRASYRLHNCLHCAFQAMRLRDLVTFICFLQGPKSHTWAANCSKTLAIRLMRLCNLVTFTYFRQDPMSHSQGFERFYKPSP